MTFPDELRPRGTRLAAPATPPAPDRLFRIPDTTVTTVHDLKAWPGYFQQVWAGRKTFEIRYDDRGYQRGDRVRLREWDRHWHCSCDDKHGHTDTCERYTGRIVEAEIGYVCASTPARGQQRGFNGNGYVVLALCHLVNLEAGRETP